jgi:hypothetical protein
MTDRPRKTIEVRTLADRLRDKIDPTTVGGKLLNNFVADKINEGNTPEQVVRMVLTNELEQILLNTGNYNGFQWTGEGNRTGEVDHTARRYYGVR